jgi:predicted acyl esterase
MARTDAALRERSAVTYIDKINQSGVPIYIENGINDDLFTSGSVVKFFQQLSVPKKLALINGIHATGEAPGLLFMSSWIWDEAHKWFAQWLKEEPTGIMQEPAVYVYTKWNDGLAAFDDFPVNDTHIKLYFDQEGTLSPGESPDSSAVYTIENGILSDTNSGTPIISPLLYSYANVPVRETWKIGGNSASFVTDPFQEPLTIMGLPKAEVFLRPDAQDYQFNLFLYDLGPSGRGKMITHIPKAQYFGQKDAVIPVELDFNLVSYRLEPNHRLKLIVSTFDPSAQLLMPERFRLDIMTGGGTPSSLTIPVQTGLP